MLLHQTSQAMVSLLFQRIHHHLPLLSLIPSSHINEHDKFFTPQLHITHFVFCEEISFLDLRSVGHIEI